MRITTWPGQAVGSGTWRAVSTCGPPNRSASMTSMTTTSWIDLTGTAGRPASASGPVRRRAIGL
ncbi:MAG: hypothetical protein ACRDND_11605, partial [Streptosporangiaceae bacterium]